MKQEDINSELMPSVLKRVMKNYPTISKEETNKERDDSRNIEFQKQKDSAEDIRVAKSKIGKKNRKPSSHCLLCEKTIDEIGGKRVVAQKTLGTYISATYRGGGDPDFPDLSIKIDDARYILFCGKKGMWTDELIEKVKEIYFNNEHPWFCQKCAGKTCHICGEILNNPIGSDVIYDDGCISHVAVLCYNPGCVNESCENHKYVRFGKV